MDLYTFERVLSQHREDMLREAQHLHVTAVLEESRDRRFSLLMTARYALGQWMIESGIRLQAFPAKLAHVEYSIRLAGACDSERSVIS